MSRQPFARPITTTFTDGLVTSSPQGSSVACAIPSFENMPYTDSPDKPTSPPGDKEAWAAVLAHDGQFDGQFVYAVATTGVYCRPSCPVVPPKAENMTFYPSAAAAQQAGFRACKRCRPDASPGSPEWDLRSDLVARAVRLIADGVVDREGVPGLSSRLGWRNLMFFTVLGFTVTSLLCGVANSLETLIFARVAQGAVGGIEPGQRRGRLLVAVARRARCVLAGLRRGGRRECGQCRFEETGELRERFECCGTGLLGSIDVGQQGGETISQIIGFDGRPGEENTRGAGGRGDDLVVP